MAYEIKNAVSSKYVPQWGNGKKFIAIHYLGVVGQGHELAADGCGAHFYIYWDGTIYQRCSLDAVVWAVGTAGYYTQKHPQARNANTISIEMCCKCDGDSRSAEDKRWYFTQETQEACAWLVRKLMKELGIPAENVLRHYDIVNKTCPAPYVHNNQYRTSWTWEGFKARIGGSSPAPAEADAPMYRVRRTWEDADSQVFAGTLDGAKKACLAGYSVYDESGKQVYTVKAKGFQAASLKGLTEAERIKKIAPLYQDCMCRTGMLASVGIAQFCLESGYGSTNLAELANNLHGMKAELSGNTWPGSVWDGSSTFSKYSPEQDTAGNTTMQKSTFRKYACCEDSISDRAAYFIGATNGSGPRYPGINQITDYKEQIRLIKAGGYATDVSYVEKLVNLVERWNLFQYDDGVELPTQDGGDILPETEQQWYRVRRSWAEANTQKGAYHDLALARKCADENPGYKVFDGSGTCVYEPVKKSAAEIAKEVIAGKWGNGDERQKKLEAAGYDYAEVQKKVNQLMK